MGRRELVLPRGPFDLALIVRPYPSLSLATVHELVVLATILALVTYSVVAYRYI
jgi:hypothetical protein